MSGRGPARLSVHPSALSAMRRSVCCFKVASLLDCRSTFHQNGFLALIPRKVKNETEPQSASSDWTMLVLDFVEHGVLPTTDTTKHENGNSSY
jgi:hypothetical protein